MFRDINNYPVCKDCLNDDLNDYWDDDFQSGIIDEVRNCFNGNYARWSKNFFKTHTPCEGIHDIEWWVLTKDLVEINGVKYCPECIDKMEDKKELKEDKK